MRRFALALPALTLLATACGGQGEPDEVNPRRTRAVARPLEVYQQVGMLAGPEDFPAVARTATLAGPPDSTYLIISMSMPNSAIRFLRDEGGFRAEYRVAATVLQDSAQMGRIERSETVRVASFAETSRTEESIVFQDVLTLAPGRYVLRIQASDVNSSRGFRAVDTLDVPSYPRDAKLSTPVFIYQAAERQRSVDRPKFVINTRNTIAYGGDSLSLYLEQYGNLEPQPVPLRIVDESGAVLWSSSANFAAGTPELRHALVAVPTSNLGIGRMWLEVDAQLPAKPQRIPVLVTISEQWMVANFDEVLRFLIYIGTPNEVDSLRNATGPERRARWESFWARRDPLPATPVNEFRERFFERLRAATDQFGEVGRPGWETHRGQVFIVLGPPDDVIERQVGRDITAQSNMVEWLYESLPGGRLVLQFFDRTGFGRYELTQSSEASFRRITMRMRPKS